ncbi:hypothetical protein OROGR_009925 [Orobanche gracilis]
MAVNAMTMLWMFIIAAFPLFFSPASPVDPKELKMALYHRNFFENETVEARLKRDASRFIYLTSVLSDSVTAIVSPSSGEYVVKLSIGSMHDTQLLVLDTGSPVTWWQCGPCEANKCYKQSINTIYNSASSSTFHAIDCKLTPSNCDFPVVTCSPENRCEYTLSYGGGQKTLGFIAYEDIMFPFTQTRYPILFGCGKDQRTGNRFLPSFSGILGLGAALHPVWGKWSLSRQLNSTLFTFCLPNPNSRRVERLAFYNEKPRLLGRYNVEVPILREDMLFYYVQLAYINIGYYTIHAKIFAPTHGKVFVDSGTTISRIPRSIYKLMKESTMRWLGDRKLKPVDNPPPPFDLCYRRYSVYKSDFPNMELVFESPSTDRDTLILGRNEVVIEWRRWICLAFSPSDHHFILGNTQLHGTGLLFDVSAVPTLTFVPNTCFP